MSPIAFLVIILAVALLAIAVVGRGSSNQPRRKGRSTTNRVGGIDREFVGRKWQSIELIAGGGGSLRDAVMEADTLLDYAMKQSGIAGDTMGDRLKNSGNRFSNLNAIWTAHKLRNSLAHEAQFDLVPSMAQEAVRDFKRGLQDLGAL